MRGVLFAIYPLMRFIFPFRLEKVLEAITIAGERRNVERFGPIVEGLRDRSVQLQVSTRLAVAAEMVHSSGPPHPPRFFCFLFGIKCKTHFLPVFSPTGKKRSTLEMSGKRKEKHKGQRGF